MPCPRTKMAGTLRYAAPCDAALTHPRNSRALKGVTRSAMTRLFAQIELALFRFGQVPLLSLPRQLPEVARQRQRPDARRVVFRGRDDVQTVWTEGRAMDHRRRWRSARP